MDASSHAATIQVRDADEARAIFAAHQRRFPVARSVCAPSGTPSVGGVVGAAAGVLPGCVGGVIAGMAVLAVALPIAIVTSCTVVLGMLAMTAGFCGAFWAIGAVAGRITAAFGRWGRNQSPPVAVLAAVAAAVLGSAGVTALPWLVHPLVGSPQPTDAGLWLIARTVLQPAPFLGVLGAVGGLVAAAIAASGARRALWDTRFCAACGRTLAPRPAPTVGFDDAPALRAWVGAGAGDPPPAASEPADVALTLCRCPAGHRPVLEGWVQLTFDWPGRSPNENAVSRWRVLSTPIDPAAADALR